MKRSIRKVESIAKENPGAAELSAVETVRRIEITVEREVVSVLVRGRPVESAERRSGEDRRHARPEMQLPPPETNER
jgi:hypothetical protein